MRKFVLGSLKRIPVPVYVGFLVFFCCLFIFRKCFFRDYVLLFTDIGADTVNAIFPYFCAVSDYFRESGFPSWTFRGAGGFDLWSSMLLDPFHWILFALGSKKLAFALHWVFALKLAAIGVASSWFFCLRGASGGAAVLGGVAASFCGFLIFQGVGWHYPHITLALVFWLFAALLEYSSRAARPLWIVLASGLFSLCGLQYLPFLCASCGILVVLRQCRESGGLREFIEKTSQTALLMILGILATSVVYFRDFQTLSEIARLDLGRYSALDVLQNFFSLGVFSQDDVLFRFARLLGNSLLGGFSQGFKGPSNSMEFPLFYAGVFLLPLAFAAVLRRRPRPWVNWLLLAIVASFFVSLHPYSVLYGLIEVKARHTVLFPVFLLIVLAMEALDSLWSAQEQPLLPFSLGLLLSLGLALGTIIVFAHRGIPAERPQWTVFWALGAYTVLFFFRTCLRRPALTWLIVLSGVVELVDVSEQSTSGRPLVSGRMALTGAGHFDDSASVISDLVARYDGFFRIEKGFLSREWNDSMAQGFFGVKSYTPMNSASYVRFLRAFDVSFPVPGSANWVGGMWERPQLASLLATRFFVSKGAPPPGAHVKLVSKSRGLSVYENLAQFPFGFVYENSVPEDSVKGLGAVELESIVLTKAIVDNSNSEELDAASMAASGIGSAVVRGEQSRVGSDPNCVLRLSHWSEADFAGTVSCPYGGILFLSVPFNSAWKLLLDGKTMSPYRVNFGFLGVKVAEGFHTVGFTFRPWRQWGYLGSLLSLIGLGLTVLFWILSRRTITPR
jgi:hypothetical protein